MIGTLELEGLTLSLTILVNFGLLLRLSFGCVTSRATTSLFRLL